MKTRAYLGKIASASLLAMGLIGTTTFAKDRSQGLEDHGKIQSVNSSEQQLTLQESNSKQPQVFTWNADTRFVEHDHMWSKSKPITADQLRAGEPVKIHYQKENDQLVAKTVVISHSNKAAASATSSTY